MCDEYKIDGYPTIKMLKDGQTIDFDAKPTIENLTLLKAQYKYHFINYIKIQ